MFWLALESSPHTRPELVRTGELIARASEPFGLDGTGPAACLDVLLSVEASKRVACFRNGDTEPGGLLRFHVA